MKTYLEGHAFNGRSGRTTRNLSRRSRPARAPRGRAQRALHRARRRRVRLGRHLRRLVETPNTTRLAGRGSATRTSTQPRCARPPEPACSPGGTTTRWAWPTSPSWPPVTPATTRASPGPGGHRRHVAPCTATTPSPSASGTTPHRRRCGPAGPYDRWPTGPLFGFDHFYGFMGGDNDHWYPKLFLDSTPIDQPKTPRAGQSPLGGTGGAAIVVHLQQPVGRSRQALAAVHGVRLGPPTTSPGIDRQVQGKFDMGWDKYRESRD